jgi:hypothetical protein
MSDWLPPLEDRYSRYPWEEEVGRGEAAGGGEGGGLGGGDIGWLVAGAVLVVVAGVVMVVALCFPE